MTVRTSSTVNLTTQSKSLVVTEYQATLADAVLTTFVIPAAGFITKTEQFVRTGCSGTANVEKTEIEVTKGGVSILTAVTVINKASLTGIVAGAITGGRCAVVKGDKIVVSNNYTADGAGGNTGADLCVSLHYQVT